MYSAPSRTRYLPSFLRPPSPQPQPQPSKSLFDAFDTTRCRQPCPPPRQHCTENRISEAAVVHRKEGRLGSCLRRRWVCQMYCRQQAGRQQPGRRNEGGGMNLAALEPSHIICLFVFDIFSLSHSPPLLCSPSPRHKASPSCFLKSCCTGQLAGYHVF